ncbi:MAG: cytidine deaminase [Bacteriovoracia bacterium]
MTDQKLQEVFAAAVQARNNAHAPYSKFRVGAAILLPSGEIVGGCNVENASYGATICAERNAFNAAVAKFGKINPEALVLVTEPEATPCGICLQVMAEFCGPDFPVYVATPKGIQKKVELRQFLPQPFGPDKLK